MPVWKMLHKMVLVWEELDGSKMVTLIDSLVVRAFTQPKVTYRPFLKQSIEPIVYVFHIYMYCNCQ